MKAIRKVAKSGQVSLTPEIIDLMDIGPGDYIEFDVIRVVRKADAKMEESELRENPLMPTLEPILA
jgi:bifunctional DNA-binding transcriptional regulator/antitoxin component of YhaV-PrlF toxin-antitoxin module